MINRIFTEEPNPLASDMWQNVGDSTYLLESKCNFLGSSAVSVGLLFMQEDIVNWAMQQKSDSLSLMALYGYFIFTFIADFSKLSGIYTTNFISHYDPNSVGIMFGKFTNMFVNFISFYLLSTATGATFIP